MIPEKEEAVMLALAEVAQQLREISTRVARLEATTSIDHERLAAHALLIAQARRRLPYPTLRSVYEAIEERAA